MRNALKHVFSLALTLVLMTGVALGQHDATITQDKDDTVYLNQVNSPTFDGSTADITQDSKANTVKGLVGTRFFKSVGSRLTVKQSGGSILRGRQVDAGNHRIDLIQTNKSVSEIVQRNRNNEVWLNQTDAHADIQQSGNGSKVRSLLGSGNKYFRSNNSTLYVRQDGGSILRGQQRDVGNHIIEINQSSGAVANINQRDNTNKVTGLTGPGNSDAGHLDVVQTGNGNTLKFEQTLPGSSIDVTQTGGANETELRQQ